MIYSKRITPLWDNPLYGQKRIDTAAGPLPPDTGTYLILNNGDYLINNENEFLISDNE